MKKYPPIEKVLEDLSQGDAIINTSKNGDETIFVERIVKRLTNTYIKVSHEREIDVREVTMIKHPASKKILFKKS